jgi:hypothetical protein
MVEALLEKEAVRLMVTEYDEQSTALRRFDKQINSLRGRED